MAPCENVSVWGGERGGFLSEGGRSNGGEAFSLFGSSAEENGTMAVGNCSFWNSSAKAEANCSVAVSLGEVPVKLNKFQIIKAVVLAGVTVVIMISICRMVFQLFVRYNVRQDR